MSDSQRNLFILVALAVVGVLFSGVFGVAAGGLSALLNIAFTIAIIWFLVISYRRHSGTIAAMPAVPRLVLQVAGATLVIVFATGSSTLLPAPFGWSATNPGIFWGLILLCAFGLWWSWQQRTSRW
jgi:hypothetical protein